MVGRRQGRRMQYFRIGFCLMVSFLQAGVVSAAPSVGGDITVANNRAETVIVLGGSGGAALSAGGFLGSLGLTLSGGFSNNGAKVNINSVAIDGDTKIGGRVSVTGNSVDNVVVLGSSVNVNSVAMGQ
jgi:hypothetical protein